MANSAINRTKGVGANQGNIGIKHKSNPIITPVVETIVGDPQKWGFAARQTEIVAFANFFTKEGVNHSGTETAVFSVEFERGARLKVLVDNLNIYSGIDGDHAARGTYRGFRVDLQEDLGRGQANQGNKNEGCLHLVDSHSQVINDLQETVEAYKSLETL